jgi:hypothetical protein
VKAVPVLIRRTAMPTLLLAGDLTHEAEILRAASSQA